MKYIIFLLAGLLYLQPASACKCVPMPELKNVSQLKSYSFIARVKIVDDGDVKKNGGPEKGLLKFKVVQQFKGGKHTQLYEMAKGTSCDMYIVKGQEWLVFGKMVNGKLTIGPCDRNVMYSTLEDGKNVIAEGGVEILKKLQMLYRKSGKA